LPALPAVEPPVPPAPAPPEPPVDPAEPPVPPVPVVSSSPPHALTKKAGANIEPARTKEILVNLFIILSPCAPPRLKRYEA
jgi:hypothetical protein